MTPIQHESLPLPDPQEQTQRLRSALDAAVQALLKQETALATEAADDLQMVSELVAPPPESYPELDELDEDICEALTHLPGLCANAEAPEIRHTLKLLRRIILSDRRRLDPDPERHRLDVAIALRQIWLIGHRSGLLSAHTELLQLQRLQRSLPPEDSRLPLLEEHISILEQYAAAQDGYGSSVQTELDDLLARRNQ